MNSQVHGGGPMICPRCGATMNHHADKVLFNGISTSSPTDSTAAGFIEEMHSCPKCGASASRPTSN